MQTDNGAADIGRHVRHLDKLARRRQLAGQQRIGEDLAQGVGTAAVAVALQAGDVDVVGRRQLEKNLDGQRPLVALNQVEITRRYAEIGGHAALAQSQIHADAAQPRPGKYLAVSHGLSAHCFDTCDSLTSPDAAAVAPPAAGRPRMAFSNCPVNSLIFHPTFTFAPSRTPARRIVNAAIRYDGSILLILQF